MNYAHQENFEGYRIKIFYDDDPILNPRTYQDNASTILAMHDRYNLSDEKTPKFNSGSEMVEYVKGLDALAVKSLYIYDHSGITISTTPFSCPWDSGQIGFVYVTKESMKRMGFKNEDMTIEKANEVIDIEVKEYDLYLKGEVYGYMIDGPGLNDSCGGYVGEMDYCLEDARQMVRRHIEDNKKALTQINDAQWKALATKCMRPVCLYCDESFETEEKFIEHMKAHHASDVLKDISNANP